MTSDSISPKGSGGREYSPDPEAGGSDCRNCGQTAENHAVIQRLDGAEERYCYDVENACPFCGGSGHKDDVSEPTGAKLSEAAWKIAAAMEVHAALGTTTKAKAEEVAKHLLTLGPNGPICGTAD